MQNQKNRTPRLLIVLMSTLVIISLGIALIYYNEINKSVDPRIKSARILYEKYNDFASTEQYDSVFQLMDKIESIYRSVPHYSNSFEIAVISNNRAACYLSLYINTSEKGIADSLEYLLKAETELKSSILCYQQWDNLYGSMDEKSLLQSIRPGFFPDNHPYSMKLKEKYIQNRVDEIITSKIENQRRLSVSYTNLGIVKRHQLKYDSAAFYYKKALELWEHNLSADNNLNILLNKPLKKRTLIQKLFPPDKSRDYSRN